MCWVNERMGGGGRRSWSRKDEDWWVCVGRQDEDSTCACRDVCSNVFSSCGSLLHLSFLHAVPCSSRHLCWQTVGRLVARLPDYNVQKKSTLHIMVSLRVKIVMEDDGVPCAAFPCVEIYDCGGAVLERLPLGNQHSITMVQTCVCGGNVAVDVNGHGTVTVEHQIPTTVMQRVKIIMEDDGLPFGVQCGPLTFPCVEIYDCGGKVLERYPLGNKRDVVQTCVCRGDVRADVDGYGTVTVQHYSVPTLEVV